MQQLLTAIKCTPADRSAWALLDAMPPLMWHVRRHLRAQRAALSMPQFRALVMVANAPDGPLSAVAEQLDLSLPTTSRLVGGLVAAGLLRRCPCEDDRRQVLLAVTAKGRAVLDAAWSSTAGDLAARLAHLPAADLVAVERAMAVVRPLFGSLGLPSPAAR